MQTETREPKTTQRLPVKWQLYISFRPSVRAKVFFSPQSNGDLQVMEARVRRISIVGCLLAAAMVFAGCSAPAVQQQRLVAKPNMTFSDAAAYQYNSSRLLGQQATGLAGTTGPQNSGCTSCR